MSTTTAREEGIRAIYEHAASLVKAGKSKSEVQADLESRGIHRDGAAIVAKNLFELRSKVLRKAAYKNMVFGAAWCVGGTTVTVLTYQAASGGGVYVVAWGAILFGAIQFLQGLAHMSGQ